MVCWPTVTEGTSGLITLRRAVIEVTASILPVKRWRPDLGLRACQAKAHGLAQWPLTPGAQPGERGGAAEDDDAEDHPGDDRDQAG